MFHKNRDGHSFFVYKKQKIRHMQRTKLKWKDAKKSPPNFASEKEFIKERFEEICARGRGVCRRGNFLKLFFVL